MSGILRFLRSGLMGIAIVLPARLPAAEPRPGDVYPVRPAQIDRLKKDLITYIYAEQTKEGLWHTEEDVSHAPEGSTALCVYALLAAGESPRAPKLKPAIDHLLAARLTKTYVVAMRLNACAYLPPQMVAAVVKADQQFMVDAMVPTIDPATKKPNPNAGLYDYDRIPTPNRYDHSVSQYGVLGMWIAEQMGSASLKEYWREVEAAWVRDQNKDGGWTYANNGESTGTMTAAGVATLFITQDYVHFRPGGGVLAAPAAEFVNAPLDRGVDWLAKRFRADINPASDGEGPPHPFYWLYGIERVGIASGLKYLGNHNWFDEGLREIAGHDRKGGYTAGTPMEKPIHAAAFSLLFISRGQKPILINKLQLATSARGRSRDAANISRWYSKRFETDLLWQSVRLEADTREFHDAPILYYTGTGELPLKPGDKVRLKQYIEDGGFLLINAEQQDKATIDSAKAMLAEMFPQYPIRPLPDDHPARSGAYKLKKPMEILGVSNGVRELALILSERDIPRFWQFQLEKQDPDAFEAAANIFFYASDRNRLRVRGQTNIVIRDPAIKPRQQAALARIKTDGNWDPEPGGWRRMQNILHNQNEIELAVETISLANFNLEGYQFAHLTGTTPVKLTPEHLAEIKKFIASGGTLIVDAAGGSQSFAQSVEPELEKIIPGLAMKQISPDDGILADTRPLPEPEPHIFPDDPIKPLVRPTVDQPLDAEYRRAAKPRVSDPKALELKGIRVGRRYGIIFSPLDLSQGLTGQNIDGVPGFTPATATEITRRIMVNSLPKAR